MLLVSNFSKLLHISSQTRSDVTVNENAALSSAVAVDWLAAGVPSVHRPTAVEALSLKTGEQDPRSTSPHTPG